MVNGSLWDKKHPIEFTSEVDANGLALTIKAYKTESDEDYVTTLPTAVDVTADSAVGEAANVKTVMTVDFSQLTEPGSYYLIVLADEGGTNQLLVAKVEAEVSGLDGYTSRV